MKKVVSIRASSLGDCLMGKYFLDNVRAHFPWVRTAIVTGARSSMVKDLFAAHPEIEVIEANRRSVRSVVSLLRTYAGSDMVVTPYTGGRLNLGTKLVARLLAKGGGLVGYTDGSHINSLLYDQVLDLKGAERAPRLHETDALEALGIPVATTAFSLKAVPKPETLSRFGLTPKTYLVVHLFSGADARGISPKRRSELLGELARMFPTMKLVLTGTAPEVATYSTETLPASVVIAGGTTSIQEIIALLDEAYGVISLDTGVGHMAAHRNLRLVVLASCRGTQWWSSEQYTSNPNTTVLARTDICAGVHDGSAFAKCMMAIDVETIAKTAQTHFHE